jgi:nitrate reductase beta subunit
MDRVEQAALADDKDLVSAQREIILDPFDPKVIEAAKKEGISDDWIDAAQRSPIYEIVKKWEIGLPLHPEFRTLPSLFYIPPLAPITTSAGKDSPSDSDVFDMEKPSTGPLLDLDELDKFRLPLRYLASMFGAGNQEVIKKALLRQLAVRHYERSLRVEKGPNVDVLTEVGLTEEDARKMVRALSLSFYDERFVVPTTKRETAEMSPYIERGFAGFDKMNPWSPMKRRKSYFKSHHTGSKEYE